jgi:hypothetical protein
MCLSSVLKRLLAMPHVFTGRFRLNSALPNPPKRPYSNRSKSRLQRHPQPQHPLMDAVSRKDEVRALYVLEERSTPRHILVGAVRKAIGFGMDYLVDGILMELERKGWRLTSTKSKGTDHLVELFTNEDRRVVCSVYESLCIHDDGSLEHELAPHADNVDYLRRIEILENLQEELEWDMGGRGPSSWDEAFMSQTAPQAASQAAPQAAPQLTEVPADECSGDCPVCFEGFDEVAVKLRCGHVYHRKCIVRWFETWVATPRTCPYCRSSDL